MSTFEIVQGIEGACLLLDDYRIAGPKPWGGGQVVKKFETEESYVRERTCHDLGGTDYNGERVFNCSECGCVLSLFDSEGVNTLCTNFICDYPRFCLACGAKIKEENE